MAKSKIALKIGSNIEALRQSLGMTQLQLAHKIGHKGADAGAYISKVESGALQPRFDTLLRFAKALGVELNQLLS